jgi:hypothetical protein
LTTPLFGWAASVNVLSLWGKKQSIPPLDIEFIRERSAVRQDETLVRRECHVAALSHEPATFRGPGNRLMVRVYVNGAIRRVLASRIAWCLSCGEWPKGSCERGMATSATCGLRT